jgi:heme exporter protein A
VASPNSLELDYGFQEHAQTSLSVSPSTSKKKWYLSPSISKDWAGFRYVPNSNYRIYLKTSFYLTISPIQGIFYLVIMVKITAHNLARKFGFRGIFKDINFEVTSPSALVISGPNGSGKSTLLKIIAGLLAPTSGKVDFHSDSSLNKPDQLRQQVVYIAPEMNFYDDLTGLENLRFYASVSGDGFTSDEFLTALKNAGLNSRGGDFIKGYSSGMKMRLKYALAFLKKPPILMLDEPSTNLDREGKTLVYRLMEEQRKTGLLIYATNEENELGFADEKIVLG